MRLKEKLELINSDNSSLVINMLNDKTIEETLSVTYKNNHQDLAEWNAFHNNTILHKIIDKLFDDVRDIWDEIDYIAALGASGSPLAVGLSLLHNKNFIFINDKWGITKKFQPIKPTGVNIEGKKILLTDSVLRTGLTAYNGFDVIKEEGGIPILLVIALLPDWIDDSILDELKDVEFYNMFHWNKSVENEALKLNKINKKLF